VAAYTREADVKTPGTSAGTFRLFVYGTLKRGGIRHGPLASQRYLGEARTAPRYALLDLGDFPGLVARGEGGTAVEGELYELDRSLVSWLDAQEGAPEWFALEPVEVAGQEGVVWAYFYQGDAEGKPAISSGRWENR
jgi:gamma-glutamylcyclotransferase (GGCT)/AIG2-like uncharacterized protein YtfP